MDEAAN